MSTFPGIRISGATLVVGLQGINGAGVSWARHDSPTAPTRSVWVLLGALCVLGPTTTEAAMPIERTMREIQARYHAIYAIENCAWQGVKPYHAGHGPYIAWPSCTGCATVSAPPFPADGFYGDLEKTPEKAAELVRAMATSLWSENLYAAFLNPEQPVTDGQVSDLVPFNETGLSLSLRFLAATDLAPPPGIAVPSGVTAENYVTVLQKLREQVSRLTTVYAPCHLTDRKLRRGLWYEHQQGLDDTRNGALAYDCWGSIPWSQEATVEPGYSEETALEGRYYKARMQTSRAKLEVVGLGSLSGRGQFYVAVGGWAAGTVLTANAPPTTADRRLRPLPTAIESGYANSTLSADIGVTAETPAWTALPVPPADVNGGWRVYNGFFAFQPDFKTDPDPLSCSANPMGCCSCAQPQIPGSVVPSLHGGAHLMIGLGAGAEGNSAGCLLLRACGLRDFELGYDQVFLAGQSLSPAAQILDGGGVLMGWRYSLPMAFVEVKGQPSGFTVFFFRRNADGSQASPEFKRIGVLGSDAPAPPYHNYYLTITEDGLTTAKFTLRFPDYRWELETGFESGRPALRHEVRERIFADSGGSGVLAFGAQVPKTRLVEQTTIQNDATSGTGTFVTFETNQWFAWGWQRTGLVEGNPAWEAMPLTNVWTYGTTAGTPAWGQATSFTGPGGYWETYTYNSDGRLWRVYSQYKGNPQPGTPTDLNSRMLTATYSSSPGRFTRTVEERLPADGGSSSSIVSRRSTDSAYWGGNCQWTETVGDAGSGQALITRMGLVVEAASASLRYRLKWIERPDGTMSIFTPANGSDWASGWIEQAGQPSAGSDPGSRQVLNGFQTKVGFAPLTYGGLFGGVLIRELKEIKDGSPAALVLKADTLAYGDFSQPTSIAYSDGTAEAFVYGTCCGLTHQVDRNGAASDFSYDALKRLRTQTVNGVTSALVRDALGDVTDISRYKQGVPEAWRHYTYDSAGRLKEAKENLADAARTTSVAWTSLTDKGAILLKATVTYPDASQTILRYYPDGTPESVSGSAARPRQFSLGVDAGGPYRLLSKSGDAGAQWERIYFDPALRATKRVFSGPSPANPPQVTYRYNHLGQPDLIVSPDGVHRVLEYDAQGRLTAAGIDWNHDDALTTSAPDRRTRRALSFANGWAQLCAYEYAGAPEAAGNDQLNQSATVGLTPNASLNLVDTFTQKTGTHDLTTTVTTSPVAANGTKTLTTTRPDNSRSVQTFDRGRLAKLEEFDSGTTLLRRQQFSYDDFGRLWKAQTLLPDGASWATTTFDYFCDDQLKTVTLSASGVADQVQSRHYNSMGRLDDLYPPGGGAIHYQYNALGRVTSVSDSRTYPVEYVYDSEGRLTEMHTHPTVAGSRQTSVTTWFYHPNFGRLAQKRQNGIFAQRCDYDSTTMQLTWRLTCRSILTKYHYNAAGELDNIDYSDATPDVALSKYDRQGQLLQIGHNGSTIDLQYDLAGFPTTQTGYGYQIERQPDTLERLQTLFLRPVGGANLLSTTLAYDGASRLDHVQYGPGTSQHSARYRYELNHSPLPTRLEFSTPGAGSPSANTQWTYDNLDRLDTAATRFGSSSAGTPALLHDYDYNVRALREKVTLEDSSFWTYGYNDRDEVTSAGRNWSPGQFVAGQQFTYAFDDIGNRLSTSAGGDATGANLRTASYAANLLSQYGSRSVARYLDVQGSAAATALVKVNEQPATRHGEYFRAELAVPSSGQAQWTEVSITGILPNNPGQPNVLGTLLGHRFVPPDTETYQYDEDGNLIQDARWTYQWDAENRLVSLSARNDLPAAVPASARKQIRFRYDFAGRRIERLVYPWTGSGYSTTAEQDTCFVYEGWNLVAELDARSSPAMLVRSYAWGRDLSGSRQGAGGVGGLLGMTVHSGANAGTYYYAYDGQGNVAALLQPAAGGTVTVAARYEYGPFGELLRSEGPMAAVNPFRFSTKYHDDPAGLVYFGYRTYKPETGRWLNRDPIGEMGGVNLYQFSRNNGPNLIDPTGLQSWMLWQVETGVWAAMHAEDLAGWYQRSDVFSAQVGLSESLAGLGLDAAAMQEMFSGQTAVNLLYGGSMTPCADLARGWFQGKVLSITSSFTPRQGEFYAWTGFAGEVAPALIPFGGWEGQAGRSGSQIMMLLGRRAPRLLRFANTDLAKAFSKLTEKGLQSCESEIGMAAKTEATVFRQGTFADETIGWEGNYVKGRQWATDNPLTTPNYAQKYGLPAENTGNPDWVVGGRTQGPYSTRPAPASHNNPLNPGGATEVLPQNPNDVRLDWFHMPD